MQIAVNLFLFIVKIFCNTEHSQSHQKSQKYCEYLAIVVTLTQYHRIISMNQFTFAFDVNTDVLFLQYSTHGVQRKRADFQNLEHILIFKRFVKMIQ